jgi:predicted nuclease of restriction endonuclease-like (RecB) superfamily
LLKEPLVLEFLGLSEQARYSESDLEGAIISQIEHFLLELGKGFLFEARQKRFTFDDDHFFRRSGFLQLKRRRDGLQADAVQELLEKYLPQL